MSPIRVAVVDDQTLVREGLASLLALVPDLAVVGKASGGHEAQALVAEQSPDVVLMDVRMPGMNGVAATREICVSFPSTKVLILTTFEDDEYVFEALRAGAAGYLLKNADLDHLAEAIRAVHAGQSVLDPAVTQKVIRRLTSLADGEPAEPVLTERLTDRERQVLRLMADGLTNAEIAGKLCLAEGTVKNLVSRILFKLGARDRAQAVHLATEWVLSALDPLSNTLGFDGGYLEPGRVYRRQFTSPGSYPYGDGMGRSGLVVVEPRRVYLPIILRGYGQ